MAYDAVLAEKVRQRLAGRRDLAEQQMMGAFCFMLGGHMCCGVSGTALMVRVGRDAYEAALAEPHVRPMEVGGRRTSGFILVDQGGIGSNEALGAWVQRGVDFAATLLVK